MQRADLQVLQWKMSQGVGQGPGVRGRGRKAWVGARLVSELQSEGISRQASLKSSQKTLNQLASLLPFSMAYYKSLPSSAHTLPVAGRLGQLTSIL